MAEAEATSNSCQALLVAEDHARQTIKSTRRGLELSGPTQRQAQAGMFALQEVNAIVVVGDDLVLPRNLATACEWSQLQQDVLINIFGQLQVPDLVSSGAVCRSWRLSYLAVRRLRLCSPNQSPYLVYSSADRDSNTATLHNLSTNKLYYHVSLPDPPFRSRYIVGSSHGWLVTADEQSQLHLLNPVTGAQVTLPPPHTIKGVTPSFTSDGVVSRYTFRSANVEPGSIQDLERERRYPLEDRSPKTTRNYLYQKVVLSSDPSSSSADWVAVLNHWPGMHLSFARAGDTRWTWIHLQGCKGYTDIAYNDSDGLFYAVDYGGQVHAIDLNGTSPALTIRISPEIDYTQPCSLRYIVRAPWGDLLQVLRQYADDPPPTTETDNFSSDDDEFQSNSLEQREDSLDERDSEEDDQEYRPRQRDKIKVCKVDLAKQKLTQIWDLQGHAIFIGFNSTFMINSGDFPNIRPNSVYISDDNRDYIYCSPSKGREMACLSLEDASLTDMSVSDSLLQWPPPVWFRPHLA